MKKVLYTVLALSVLSTVACKSKTSSTECVESTVTVPQRDATALSNYISSNHITADFDSRGFYYTIQSSGDTKKPSQCATINIDYSGKLTNGTVFDSNVNTSLAVEGLIPGWRMAIPKIGAGGEMTLYLPPALGYGDNDSGSIPGGSILIFKIKLNAITKD